MYDALRTIHVMCFFFRSRVIHHHQLLSRAVVAFVSSVTSRAEIVLGFGEFSNNYYEKLPFMCN